ncbi:MAG: hypothetical protein ACK5LC_14775 [Coprobacillaceae bacterium]
MLIRIKKMQFLCGVCLLLQILFARWLIPFHFVATILSIVILCWQKTFRVLQVQYHYYVVGIYFYRLWLFSITGFYVLEILYLIACLYVAIIILLCSFRAIL